MKKIAIFLLSSTLLFGVAACESNTAKTTESAPNSTEQTGKTPTGETAKTNQDDAISKVRRDQLNSDIRAREQRSNVTGGDTDRANSDLAREVGNKLEANIPNGQLTVTAKDGTVAVSGTVQNQDQLKKIEPLAKEIKGVKSVNVAAKVAPAQKQ